LHLLDLGGARPFGFHFGRGRRGAQGKLLRAIAEGLRSSARALARDLRSACALKVDLMLSAVLAQVAGIE
jgi:hypothetical protein